MLTFFLLGPAQVEVTGQAIGLMEILPLLHGILAFSVAANSPWLAVLLVAITPAWKETGLIWLFGLGLYFIKRKRFGPAFGSLSALLLTPTRKSAVNDGLLPVKIVAYMWLRN